MKYLQKKIIDFINPRTDYDEAVESIFDRMLETWDSDNLTYGISSETHLEEYEYKLEETDTESGYIKIVIKRECEYESSTEPYLYIDDIEVFCNKRLINKIYSFLRKKEKEIEKIKEDNERDNKLRHLNRYKDIL